MTDYTSEEARELLRELDEFYVPHIKTNRPVGLVGLRTELRFAESETPETRRRIATAAGYLLSRFDQNYSWQGIPSPGKGYRPAARTGGLDLLGLAEQAPPDHGFYGAFGNSQHSGRHGDHHTSTGHHTLKYYAAADYQKIHFVAGSLSHTLPGSWLGQNGVAAYRDLLLETIRWAKPLHGRAGFGVVLPVDYRVAKDTARKCHFYPVAWTYRGADFTWPTDEGESAFKRISTVNWLTAVSEVLLKEIGGIDAVLAALPDRDAFPIHEYDGGFVIQAGDSPQPGGSDNWPVHYVAVHHALKGLIADDQWNPLVFDGNPLNSEQLWQTYQRRFELPPAIEAARRMGLLAK